MKRVKLRVWSEDKQRWRTAYCKTALIQLNIRSLDRANLPWRIE